MRPYIQKMPNAPSTEREELRRKLRDKIKGKRSAAASSGPQLAQRMREDATTTMLSMGFDDPELLKQASAMFKNPQRTLKELSSQLSSTETDQPVHHSSTHIESDDEEAPPPP